MSRKNVLWVDEQTLAKDASGKTYIVTGANSGVGLETTRQLIRQGGRVVMACRRTDAAAEAAEGFAGLKGCYEVIQLDLADLASVREFVTEFLKKHDRLDGLVCNAGLVTMGSGPQRTKEGLEMTMAVSFFGHFLLTELLLDLLKRSAPSRVVLLSSVMHAGNKNNRPDVQLDDLNFHNRKFNNFAAYSEAKVALVLYAKELAARLAGTDVTTASVHPGWARSNFGGNGLLMRVARVLLAPFMPFVSDSNEEAAQTTLHCLLSDDAPNHSGAYFSQSSVLYSDKECKNGGWPMDSPNPNARNSDTARKLVNLSYETVGLSN